MASRLPAPAEALFAVQQSLRNDGRVFRLIFARQKTFRRLMEQGLLDSDVHPTPKGRSYIIDASIKDDGAMLKILVGTVISLQVTGIRESSLYPPHAIVDIEVQLELTDLGVDIGTSPTTPGRAALRMHGGCWLAENGALSHGDLAAFEAVQRKPVWERLSLG